MDKDCICSQCELAKDDHRKCPKITKGPLIVNITACEAFEERKPEPRMDMKIIASKMLSGLF